jgi:hypothetical protein
VQGTPARSTCLTLRTLQFSRLTMPDERDHLLKLGLGSAELRHDRASSTLCCDAGDNKKRASHIESASVRLGHHAERMLLPRREPWPGKDVRESLTTTPGISEQPRSFSGHLHHFRASWPSRATAASYVARHENYTVGGGRHWRSRFVPPTGAMLFDSVLVNCWTQNGDYPMTPAKRCPQRRRQSAIRRSDRLPSQPAFRARDYSRRGSR